MADPITLEVTEIEWNVGKSRRAEVTLVDAAGDRLRFIDYDGADISVHWTVGQRYRISRCGVQKGSGAFDIDLAPSKKTLVDPLGPTQTTQLLVIGDTHIGRSKHPGLGDPIDPRTAFKNAIQYAVEQAVDAVVHVGDIFHESATSTDADYIDTHVFATLAAAEIPFYYITGNHSSKPGTELLAQRAGPLVTNLSCTGVVVNSHVRLFGINHYTNGDLPWQTISFPEIIPEPVSILVLHQTLAQLSGPSTEAVDLTRIHKRFSGRFDYIFSGHHHDATQGTWNETPVQYTGAAEHMSTNENPVDRVAWLVTIEDDLVTCDRYDIP